jgi:hypothetical protein
MSEFNNYPLEKIGQADSCATIAGEYFTAPDLLDRQNNVYDFIDDIPPTPYESFMEEQAELRASCGRTKHAYAIINDRGDLSGLEFRPNICASPFCRKCASRGGEQHKRLMLRYSPRFDDEIHPLQKVWHVITTTPEFPRSELPARLKELLDNTKRFHEKLRKNYGYPLQFHVLHEPKYNAEKDTYYFHSHYGISNKLFNLIKFRELYQDTWGSPLIVKFPIDKRGNKKPLANKWAWLEYVTFRRLDSILRMPPYDYFAYFRNKQLLKRIGFPKVPSRILTTIRKKYSYDHELPDGWTRIFLGKMDSSWDTAVIGDLMKREYSEFPDSFHELHTLKALLRMAFKTAKESYL